MKGVYAQQQWKEVQRCLPPHKLKAHSVALSTYNAKLLSRANRDELERHVSGVEFGIASFECNWPARTPHCSAYGALARPVAGAIAVAVTDTHGRAEALMPKSTFCKALSLTAKSTLQKFFTDSQAKVCNSLQLQCGELGKFHRSCKLLLQESHGLQNLKNDCLR